MVIIEKEMKLCPCCMEDHFVSVVSVQENNNFKGEEVSYDATYYYCETTNEMFASEEMISANDIRMKDSYRTKAGLLSSKEISQIRDKYGISQRDLAIILGWGEKTITRYESHQVQDAAHDSILKKIDQDPEWYLSLLRSSKELFSPDSFKKYYAKAKQIYESNRDSYLRKTIQSEYVRFEEHPEYCGNTRLNLDKVVDVICYYANSPKVNRLFKVKLMKLLWYSDALSYKRYGHSITGLVYAALPMGAVPLQCDLLIELEGITYEGVSFDDGFGYHFTANPNVSYCTLSENDKKVLDKIIEVFGTQPKESIVRSMHRELAYTETKPSDIISYNHCTKLSIC